MGVFSSLQIRHRWIYHYSYSLACEWGLAARGRRA